VRAENLTSRMPARHRAAYGLAAFGMFLLALGVAATGFAFTPIWPGVSLAVGGALAIVVLFVGVRLVHAAVTGTRPFRSAARQSGHGRGKGRFERAGKT
jgi:hypothetical protein